MIKDLLGAAFSAAPLKVQYFLLRCFLQQDLCLLSVTLSPLTLELLSARERSQRFSVFTQDSVWKSIFLGIVLMLFQPSRRREPERRLRGRLCWLSCRPCESKSGVQITNRWAESSRGGEFQGERTRLLIGSDGNERPPPPAAPSGASHLWHHTCDISWSEASPQWAQRDIKLYQGTVKK